MSFFLYEFKMHLREGRLPFSVAFDKGLAAVQGRSLGSIAQEIEGFLASADRSCCVTPLDIGDQIFLGKAPTPLPFDPQSISIATSDYGGMFVVTASLDPGESMICALQAQSPLFIDVGAIATRMEERDGRHVLVASYDPSKAWKPGVTCTED